jgi:endonuclease/exonuclease/phosphatase family metal-dependent hydrolase
MKVEHYITWWNVENLFDVRNSPRRPEWLEKKLNSELKKWTRTILNTKLKNLVSIMQSLNDGKGSDIYGLCEVENQYVLHLLADRLNDALPDRAYEIILHNSDDKRGIDIGVIYDTKKYSIQQLNGENKVFTYRITKRSPTRDILQIELVTKRGNNLVLLMNHWYSRLTGKYFSEPYRIISAETLSYWVMRTQEELGVDTPILVMGDFNDEPFDRSMTEYAQSTSSKKKVLSGRNPYLSNLMWGLFGKEVGTHTYGSEVLLIDQFLVAKGLIQRDAKLKVKEGSCKIEVIASMVKGKYNAPIRFNSRKNVYNKKGVSDHLPISLIIEEK